ncbi:hypothetical protein [Streptomyces sp. NPDC088812]
MTPDVDLAALGPRAQPPGRHALRDRLLARQPEVLTPYWPHRERD